MGLAEIEKKIIQDAEAEAAKLISEAKKLQEKNFAEAKAKVEAERKSFQEELKLQIMRTIEQRTQLAELTAAQQILKVKRELLQQVILAAKGSILKAEDKFGKYLKNVLGEIFSGSAEKIERVEVAAENADIVQKIVKELKPGIPVEKKDELPAGEVSLVFVNSRINCGLNGFINEQVGKLEKEIADRLFKE